MKNIAKNQTHTLKRTFAFLLTAILAVPLPALQLVNAAQTATPKEEVVYVNLDAGGKATDIYVVNSFEQKGNITDYGTYSAVRNMTSEDVITLDGDKVSITNSADKLYYEGTLKDAVLPWNISLRYYLDGKEYEADEIAGKTGALTIKAAVSQNPDADSSFYQNYALQATFMLDSKQCKNITAKGATVANAGGNKQLSYTILPGRGAEFEISADVTDFEMDAVTINGIRLNLNIDVDDGELMEQVEELNSAITALDDGAADLQTGASTLDDGADTLLLGVESLKSGSSDLDNGILALQSGLVKVQSGLDELNSKSASLTTGSSQVKDALTQIQTSLSKVSVSTDKLKKLVAASSKIKTGINQLNSSITSLSSSVGYTQYKAAAKENGLDLDTLQSGNTTAIAALNSQISTLTATYNQIQSLPGQETQATQLQAQIAQLTDIVTLLNGNNAALGSTKTYLDGVASAITELSAGAAALNQQYQSFDSAIGELSQSLSGLIVDMSSLTAAINTLVSNYTVLNQGIVDYTAGVAKLADGQKELVNGISTLASGSSSLANGSSALYQGTSKFANAVTTLSNGSTKLSDGTGELSEQTSGMESEIDAQIDELLSGITGSDTQIISFVSKKNTAVASVQFVFKTAAIEVKAPVEPKEETNKDMNIWEKFLHLFGIDI